MWVQLMTVGKAHIELTTIPDSKVRGDNMRPTWGRQDPGEPHVGHVNLAIWGG